MKDNRDYLLGRERECREAAERATDPGIGRTHLEFAERYARQAADLPSNQRLPLQIVPDA